MKKPIKLFSLVLLCVFAISMNSCRDKSYETITYKKNVPVYMSYEDFRGSFKKSAPVEINQPGKIYFKDNYLFVNEVNKGIHVINNADPSNPQIVAFYEILGNVDIAIRGNVLYADSYIDLVMIDISDILNPVEISRVENAFPDIYPPFEFGFFPYEIDKTKGVVVDWNVETVTEEVEKGSSQWYRWGFYKESMDMVNDGGWGGESTGIAGSMARFMVYQNYLYAINQMTTLKSFNIADPLQVSLSDSINIPRTIETLFYINQHLFIGSTSGMLIYSLANPAKPVHVSTFEHITSCDPVVVQGNYAYVTLRSGTECQGFTNQLDVVDITNLSFPTLKKTFSMHNPHGLGIDGDVLFICDGSQGLKAFNASDPMTIGDNLLAHFPGINAFDVIPHNNVLMLISSEGVYQYDYSDLQNIVQLSFIPIGNN